MHAPFEILYEDNHLLIINKPAMLPTMGVAESKPSVLTVAKQYIKQRDSKPGNVYLGVVSRLDAPVTGALLIAKTSKAAARLSAQFRDRKVDKTYRAMVEGTPIPANQSLQHWLRKDERHRRVHVTQKDIETAQEARLRFESVQPFPAIDATLLQIQLETGRKHQIRVQLAAIGHSVIGDRKYKSSVQFGPGIMLHSYRLAFQHPVGDQLINIQCETPDAWSQWRNKS